MFSIQPVICCCYLGGLQGQLTTKSTLMTGCIASYIAALRYLPSGARQPAPKVKLRHPRSCRSLPVVHYHSNQPIEHEIKRPGQFQARQKRRDNRWSAIPAKVMHRISVNNRRQRRCRNEYGNVAYRAANNGNLR